MIIASDDRKGKALADEMPAPSLDDLERALDEVLTTIVVFRHASRPKIRSFDQKVFETVSIDQLLATESAVVHASDLARAPVDAGLKYSLRGLGKLVHAMVGDEGMPDVAQRVCGLDDENWARRMCPLDAAWRGIGSWQT
jgi:hypothetical protein